MNTPSPLPEHRDRLPAPYEVLSRKTYAPVDLFSFYIYMRDQQRSVDYLDFWLDVSQHLSLCRHYVRELRRSALIATPDLDKASKRSSAVLTGAGIDPMAGPSGLNDEKSTPDQRLSAFLRSDSGSRHSPQNSTYSQHSQNSTPGTEHPPRPSFMTSENSPLGHGSSPGQASESPAHAVNRADIRAMAQKILYTYLLPGSEREIILPQGILNDVINAIEQENRDDPEVFDAAREYVFQAMERDAFPGFLKAKALGNIVPPDMMIRLIVGLLAMFGAFWAAFILIFLDASRATRCWLILPFTIGIYMLASHQYMLDPLLVFLGYSEYTFFTFTRIREPYVKKLLNKRASMVLLEVVLIDVALCCLFIFVPGKRL